MSKTSIEWTEATWNPVTGCDKISPGCKHCYAEVMAARLKAMGQANYRNGFEVTLQPHMLAIPLRREKPTMYFVNSMSDLFHDAVPFEYIAAVFAVMGSTSWHTYQVLTKRPARMREFFVWVTTQGPGAVTRYLQYLVDCGAVAARKEKGMDEPGPPTPEMRFVYDAGAPIVNEQMPGGRYHRLQRLGECHWRPWPLDNVWLGVSVEDRKYGLPRIDELRATPAAVRFLSVEPLLEDLGTIDLAGIDWVIVGGESGPGARPMHPEWVRNIRSQVLALRQPCPHHGEPAETRYACDKCHGHCTMGPRLFFKQWGEWCHPEQLPDETARDLDAVDPANLHGDKPLRVGKKAAGRVLDGRTWDEMPRRRA